ncbi:hypothetical protein SEVIR_5G364401v4 [Setaria viridis]
MTRQNDQGKGSKSSSLLYGSLCLSSGWGGSPAMLPLLLERAVTTGPLYRCESEAVPARSNSTADELPELSPSPCSIASISFTTEFMVGRLEADSSTHSIASCTNLLNPVVCAASWMAGSTMPCRP